MSDIAKRKIEMLKDRDDYVSVSRLDSKLLLRFKDRNCLVDEFGKVEWL